MNPADKTPESYLQDRPVLTNRQRRIIQVFLPLLLGGLCAVPVLTGELDALERLSLDWRFGNRGPLPPDPRVVIVEIGEADRRSLSGVEVRFDLRAFLDDAIEKLADAGAVAEIRLPAGAKP